MIKKYDNIEKAFELKIKDSYGFPTTCMECGCELERNTDFNYASDWTCSYTCKECKSKFAYQPTDMGQSLPWIEKYDIKDEVFGNNDTIQDGKC